MNSVKKNDSFCFTLEGCVRVAKKMTERYAVNHKGRNALEKECINKGYIVRRIGDVFPDAVESERNQLAIIALDFNEFHRRGGFIIVR